MNKGLLIGGGVVAVGLGALYLLSNGGDAGLTGIGGMTYSPAGTQGQESGEPIDWSQILPSETVVFPQQPFINPFENLMQIPLDTKKSDEIALAKPFVTATTYKPEGLTTQREQIQVAGEVKKNIGTTFNLVSSLLGIISPPVGLAFGGAGKIVKAPVVDALTEAVMSSKKETTTVSGGGSMGGFGSSGVTYTTVKTSSGSSGSWNRAAAAAAGLTTSPYSSSTTSKTSSKKESKTSSTGGSAFGGSSNSGYGGGGSGGR